MGTGSYTSEEIEIYLVADKQLKLSALESKLGRNILLSRSPALVIPLSTENAIYSSTVI